MLFVSVPSVPKEYDADVLFIVDSSIDISAKAFRNEKDFVKTIARSLNVSPGKSQAAAITYGSVPRIAFRFGPYSSFESAVETIPYIGGERRLDRALTHAGRLLTEARSSVPKVVVLLLGGKQSKDSESLGVASKQLRDLGANTFVVSVGSVLEENGISTVVYSPQDIFPVPSFDDLEALSKPIASEIARRSSE